ncbi:MAG: DoxX family membrane protein [Candidatus Doudnabacteria bacterium]|nr:DoxX family membrane protein [Candidatus Doudnabacteria bacterium]
MNYKKIVLLVLRLVLGWLLLYAGWQKLTSHPPFTAAGFLTHASTFPGLYKALAADGIIKIVNFLNVWGQIAIGVGLITGTYTKWAARAGALMMILYYFPGLKFPHITSDTHAFIVDDHIIYAAGYLVLDAFHAGKYFSVDSFLRKDL